MTDEKPDNLPEGFAERVEKVGGTLLLEAKDGIAAARVGASRIPEFMASLKSGPGLAFDMLMDLCSVDEYPGQPRFDLIYHVRNLETGTLVRIKAFAEGDPPTVPSVVDLYPTANWHEREVYDMMGIRFEGHPDLRRILMPLEYTHYPLRKDFPREGIEPERLYKRQYPD